MDETASSTGAPVLPPVPTRKRSKKVRAPRVPRGPRTPHQLRIGVWDEERRNFASSVVQPTVAMTEVVDLVAWAQKNLSPGEYDVIRVLPGKLTVAKQETFKALFVETK